MPPFTISLRRVVAVLLAVLALSASSIRPAVGAPYDYTDFWWVPAENGWGVNFTQSDNFLFAALFIYDANKNPTWYTANMTWNEQSGQFTGPLFLTHGTYFGMAWNPADNTGAVQVGTATFIPSAANNYSGTFIYSVAGVGTFTKQVTRFTITPVVIGANYVGGQSGTYSNCTLNASNRNYQDFFTSAVTQNGTSITMTFEYSGGQNPLTCTLSGTSIQNGSILRIPNARYQCSDGLDTTASVSELRATPLGFEGQFTAASVGGGCSESARFGGVLN